MDAETRRKVETLRVEAWTAGLMLKLLVLQDPNQAGAREMTKQAARVRAAIEALEADAWWKASTDG